MAVRDAQPTVLRARRVPRRDAGDDSRRHSRCTPSVSRSRSPSRTAAELQGWRRDVGDPLAPRDPDAHHPAAADRVDAGRPRPAVEEHLRTSRGGRAAVPRSTCAAPARFGRCRRSCSSRSVAGHRRLRAADRRPSGPARSRRELSFPYHPHVTVAHDLPDEACWTGRSTSWPTTRRASTVGAFSLYEHGPDEVWRPQRSFALGSGEAQARSA